MLEAPWRDGVDWDDIGDMGWDEIGWDRVGWNRAGCDSIGEVKRGGVGWQWQ